MKPIRVLVVDDSAFMRKMITDMLDKDAGIHVVGAARNGEDALKKMEEWRPDVITMDVEMPRMNGLETLEKLIPKYPVQIIMLSSVSATEITIKALENGAFDFIQKPSGSISLDIETVREELIQKIKTAAQTEMKPEVIEPKPPPPSPVVTETVSPARHREGLRLVGIGTSTGGPRALQQLLQPIPRRLNASYFIVQHMPAGFTKSLAQRLDTQSFITVVEAEDGQTVEDGTAYVAPGGYHMEVVRRRNQLRIQLSQTEMKGGHRPSVNVLFESLAELSSRYDIYSVIMTGMGSDGSEGLKQLKRKGLKWAIAQDESSCIVYGMPRSAVETGAVNEIKPLENIPTALVKQLSERKEEDREKQ